MAFDNAYITNAGARAENKGSINEDDALAWVKDDILYQIIADGNGSTENMNPASFVINEIQRFIEIFADKGMSVDEMRRMMLGAIHTANRVLLAFKRANGDVYKSDCFSTVCFSALTPDNNFIYASCGDSRIYLIRQGRMVPITKDHTEAQRLCDEGKIAKEKISTHPDRDILTSALGLNDPKIDIVTASVQPQDIVLSVTDGVYKVAQPEQILELVRQAGNCKTVCDEMVNMINLLGAPDNIAVSITYIT